MSSRRAGWALARIAVVVCGIGGLAVPAAATPPDPDTAPSQAQVDRARDDVTDAQTAQVRVQAQLDEAQSRLDAASAAAGLAAERYNAARVLLTRRDAEATRAAELARAARARAGDAQLRVDQLAADLHMRGGALERLEFFLGLADTADLARRAAGLGATGDHRSRMLREAEDAAARAAATGRAAAQAKLRQQAAAGQAREAFAAARDAEKKVAAQSAVLERRRDAAIAELARLRRTSVELERRRQEALAEAAARAGVRDRAADTRAPADLPVPADLPAPDTAGAAAAIAFAASQLGTPYVWGGAGPDSWDCSGLTMKAWAAGGKSLTHYTGAQRQETARVPVGDLKPGDLVFFGADESNIHHTGLYVGDGMMIEAPRTGLDVRYSSIYRSSLLPHGGRP